MKPNLADSLRFTTIISLIRISSRSSRPRGTAPTPRSPPGRCLAGRSFARQRLAARSYLPASPSPAQASRRSWPSMTTCSEPDSESHRLIFCAGLKAPRQIQELTTHTSVCKDFEPTALAKTSTNTRKSMVSFRSSKGPSCAASSSSAPPSAPVLSPPSAAGALGYNKRSKTW